MAFTVLLEGSVTHWQWRYVKLLPPLPKIIIVTLEDDIIRNLYKKE